MMPNLSQLVTTAEAAKLLKVSPGRVRQFVREERLKPARTIGNLHLFDRGDVQRFAKKKRPTGRPRQVDGGR